MIALATLREEAGLTVEQAAARVGFSPKYLEGVEAGELEPTPGFVAQMSEALAGVLSAGPVASCGHQINDGGDVLTCSAPSGHDRFGIEHNSCVYDLETCSSYRLSWSTISPPIASHGLAAALNEVSDSFVLGTTYGDSSGRFTVQPARVDAEPWRFAVSVDPFEDLTAAEALALADAIRNAVDNSRELDGMARA